LVQDKPNTFGSFPESNHASSAIQFVNDCLSVKVNDKSSQGSSFSGFGASSFPGNFKRKDFEIHDSSIGKTAPVCDKSFSQLFGAKPVDEHRLSQSLWAKSENLPRSASHVLDTAEFYLLAVGALLQGKEGDDLAEVKSLLLQVDQALWSSQFLLIGTLANFTLSKRREILYEDGNRINDWPKVCRTSRGIKCFKIPVPTELSSLSYVAKRHLVVVSPRTLGIFRITT
jgi:hypothetical protein